jgi:predicted regulator of Ras-like GTPase activity (Roadblock/LC7/MglB family)
MSAGPVNPLLSTRLRSMLNATTSLDALAVVSMDGLEIASAIPPEVNGARMAAMTLATFTLGEQIARELERNKLQEVYVKGESGYIVLIPLKSKAVLIALSRAGAKTGLVLLEMRRVAADLLKPLPASPKPSLIRNL